MWQALRRWCAAAGDYLLSLRWVVHPDQVGPVHLGEARRTRPTTGA